MIRKLSSATKVIFIYLAIQILPIPLVFLFPREQQIEASLNLTLLFSLIGTIWMLVVNHRKEWTPVTPLTKQPSAPLPTVFLWGILGFIGAIAIQIVTSMIEMLLFGIPSESANTEYLLETTAQYPLLIFSIVVFAPVMEELVFRKAIFTQLHVSKVSVLGAAVISSLIFALVHFDGHMLVYSTLGLWFCYLYNKTNNIYAPMLAHGLMNAYASLPIFFPQLFGG
ncbi:CPBP family intramembrane glutamic endopeptidase [Jeotgalibaca caeni]|uniref:CPBP family intramembrane glutamic endopeptidase n=1 Tax=Jeotgalibaca caeni TaxID=3028623 RepID=UPI00237D8F9D|nr:type II CAAX endopeptidase family protein [Jeotgalibaca caeni]MDE1548804.1 type II CAAX endopeptidase family protein [Jeotgalibaca caeni]